MLIDRACTNIYIRDATTSAKDILHATRVGLYYLHGTGTVLPVISIRLSFQLIYENSYMLFKILLWQITLIRLESEFSKTEFMLMLSSRVIILRFCSEAS